ncbi:MAG: LacI family transcriptional regulator [Opitutaceae bacterium]|nr:LacI family transcriptional regulator [Opitutaceae bacterium]
MPDTPTHSIPSAAAAGFRGKPASLKDIAREAGVSYSLVSKVLSGNMGTTGVRKELREKILNTARKMDYRPHPLAAALKEGRKGAIGVMLHHFGERGSGLVEDLLRGISDGLDEHGLRMWLRFFEFDTELLEHIDQRLRRDVDGLIVAGVPHPATYTIIKNLHLSGLPVVSMFQHHFISGVPNVCQNLEQQGFLPAMHLLASGCTRIAHIVCAPMPLRHAGAEAAHAARGLTINPRLVFRSATFGVADGVAAVSHWLDHGLTFDGIITQSDKQAAGAIHELLRRGIRVPDDVRVTGMDNSPITETGTVSITSVTAEMEQVGRKTADMLADKLDGKTPESLLLQPRLVLRQSA